MMKQTYLEKLSKLVICFENNIFNNCNYIFTTGKEIFQH